MTLDSIYAPGVHQTMKHRLTGLQPDTKARWGRMSAHQAVCHLADALRMVLGERSTVIKGNLLLRTVVRFSALTMPMPWPKGTDTAPELDQERGGTAPTDFSADKDDLATLVDRFVGHSGRNMATHPIFGNLTRGEWGRWGYRHLDHHLTQFGQ